MRLPLHALLIVLLAISLPTPASAELWQGARSLKQNTFTGGVFGQLYFKPTTEFQAMAQGIYGIATGAQLEARLGFGSIDPYLGVFGKYTLLTEDFDVAIWGGLHTLTTGYLDFAPILSRRLTPALEVYLSPYFQVPLGSGVFGMALVVGGGFAVQPGVDVFVEAPLQLKDYYSGVSAGARFYF